jgi:hypothetical protein
MPPKKYCGNSNILPDGYDEFGDLFDCLRKGYGICKYSGKLGSRYNGIPSDPKRPKVYCGNKTELPQGYARFGQRHECLKRGFGRCLYTKPFQDQEQDQQQQKVQEQQQQDLFQDQQQQQDLFQEGPGVSRPGATKPGATKPGATKPGATKPGVSRPGVKSKPKGRVVKQKKSVRNQQQFIQTFSEKYLEQNMTKGDIERIFNSLSLSQKNWFNIHYIVKQGNIHGFYRIEPF